MWIMSSVPWAVPLMLQAPGPQILALGTPWDDEGLWFISPNEEKLNVWQKGGELKEASVDLIADGSF